MRILVGILVVLFILNAVLVGAFFWYKNKEKENNKLPSEVVEIVSTHPEIEKIEFFEDLFDKMWNNVIVAYPPDVVWLGYGDERQPRQVKKIIVNLTSEPQEISLTLNPHSKDSYTSFSDEWKEDGNLYVYLGANIDAIKRATVNEIKDYRVGVEIAQAVAISLYTLYHDEYPPQLYNNPSLANTEEFKYLRIETKDED